MPSEANQKFYYGGFARPTTTPVPDDIFDVIAPELTEAELRVLLYIVRRTFGFKKDGDSISLSQMVKGIVARDGRGLDRGTGLSRQGVINGITGLLEKGVIQVAGAVGDDGAHEVNTYSLRFSEGVANEVDYSGQRNWPGVANQVGHSNKQPKQQPVSDAIIIKMRQFFDVDDEKLSLFSKYPSEKIDEKLRLLRWKLQTRTRGRPITDPEAWLTRALEQDLPLPPEAQELAPEPDVLAAEPVGSPRESKSAARPRGRPPGKPSYQPTPEEKTLWAQILAEIERGTAKTTFQNWLAQTDILALRQDKAVVAVPNQATKEWLTGRMTGVIRRAITSVVGYDLELEFVVSSP